jgi:hypothetical protein
MTVIQVGVRTRPCIPNHIIGDRFASRASFAAAGPKIILTRERKCAAPDCAGAFVNVG